MLFDLVQDIAHKPAFLEFVFHVAIATSPISGTTLFWSAEPHDMRLIEQEDIITYPIPIDTALLNIIRRTKSGGSSSFLAGLMIMP